MFQYLDVVSKIMRFGVDRPDRTGTGTRALFGEPMLFNLENGFPMVTTKQMSFRSSLAELLWFLAGDSDERNLRKLGCRFWEGNAYADYWLPKARFQGDAGRIYGVQWRNWRSVFSRRILDVELPIWLFPEVVEVDQLAEAIRKIENTPWDRRLVVSAWNPGEFSRMCLPPCPMAFQFFVSPAPRLGFTGRLSLMMYQRSCDMFLGVPYNISSEALLLSLVAQFTRLQPYELKIILADAHIYHNHFEQVQLQLQREPYPLPRLWIDPSIKSLDGLVDRYRWILRQVNKGAKPGEYLDRVAHLDGYQYHPAIKAPLAV